MAEYYIRTPDRNESRGPFTPPKLVTLAESGKITENTLYYDEDKKEWIPIALNPELKDEVFPERESLVLKIEGDEEANAAEKKKKKSKKTPVNITVSEMLETAETETAHARAQRRRQASLKYSIITSNYGLCLIMLLSAFTIGASHMGVIRNVLETNQFNLILNYPLLGLVLIDCLLAVSAFMGSRGGIHSLIRGRVMLTLGLGAYTGWALGDDLLIYASLAVGLGALATTLFTRFLPSLLVVIISIGGSLYLADLARDGYFNGFLDSCYVELFSK